MKSSLDGPLLPEPAPPPRSLLDEVHCLVVEVRQTNQLLQTLAEQNQTLIELLVDREEQDQQSTTDMEGNPIRVT